MLNWLKLKVIFPITAGLDNEEVSEVQKLQMGIKDGDEYESELGIYQLREDFTISQLNPRCFIHKNKVNKKYYTELVFSDGNIIYADGKPEAVYQVIEEYIDSFTE
ncbi:MAG: hypothetical protein PX635_00635 [Nostocales cyanobacterium LE14-WE12]|jgi:hypothetical protein|nr:hypothetical protein [Nostocales cyanobacterium LE14-WE12]